MCSDCKKFHYEIRGQTLYHEVKQSKHMLRQPRGWAIQADLYNRHRNEFECIEIYDTETNQHYTVEASRLETYRMEISRGFGKQYALPMSYWLTRPKDTIAPPIQPKLF